MEEECRHEEIKVNMKDIESKIKQVAKEDFLMQMEMYTKEIEMKIKLMVLDNIDIPMELHMLVIDNMINKKESESKYDQMVHNMKDNILMAKNVDLEFFILEMDLFIKENLKITTLKGLEYTNDLMEEFMKDNDIKIKWMD